MFRVTTIAPSEGRETGTYASLTTARDAMAQIVDLYVDEGCTVRGSVDRSSVVKVIDADGVLATVILSKVGN